MINVRQGIVAILQGSTAVTDVITVKDTLIDKVKEKECPILSVMNVTSNYGIQGHDFSFDASAGVGLVILVAKTETYASDLDTYISLVLSTLFTDDSLRKEYNIPQFQITYDYGEAGETDMAQARIIITFEYVDEFVPVYPDDFTKLHMDADMTEADGVIDASIDVDIPIV